MSTTQEATQGQIASAVTTAAVAEPKRGQEQKLEVDEAQAIQILGDQVQKHNPMLGRVIKSFKNLSEINSELLRKVFSYLSVPELLHMSSVIKFYKTTMEQDAGSQDRIRLYMAEESRKYRALLADEWRRVNAERAALNPASIQGLGEYFDLQLDYLKSARIAEQIRTGKLTVKKALAQVAPKNICGLILNPYQNFSLPPYNARFPQLLALRLGLFPEETRDSRFGREHYELIEETIVAARKATEGAIKAEMEEEAKQHSEKDHIWWERKENKENAELALDGVFIEHKADGEKKQEHEKDQKVDGEKKAEQEKDQKKGQESKRSADVSKGQSESQSETGKDASGTSETSKDKLRTPSVGGLAEGLQEGSKEKPAEAGDLVPLPELHLSAFGIPFNTGLPIQQDVTVAIPLIPAAELKSELDIQREEKQALRIQKAIAKAVEDCIAEIVNLTDLQVQGIRLGLTRSQVLNENFSLEHIAQIKKFIEKEKPKSKEAIQAYFSKIENFQAKQFRGLTVGWSEADVASTWFSDQHVEMLSRGFTVKELRGLNASQTTVFEFTKDRVLALTSACDTWQLQALKEGMAYSEIRGLSHAQIQFKKETKCSRADILKYNPNYNHIELLKRGYAIKDIYDLGSNQLNALSLGISISIVRKFGEKINIMPPDNLYKIYNQVYLELEEKQERERKEQEEKDRQDIPESSIAIDSFKPKEQKLSSEEIERKLLEERRKFLEAVDKALEERLLKMNTYGGHQDQDGLNAHERQALTMGVPKQLLLDKKVSRDFLYNLDSIATLLQKGYRIEDFYKLKREQILGMAEHNLTLQQVTHPNYCSDIHYLMNKTAYIYEELIVLRRWQSEAIDLDKGITLKVVTESWFTPHHASALSDGYPLEEIAGLTSLQVRTLTLVPSLTRAMVTEPWFRSEHLMALDEGFDYADIRGKNSEQVNKLREEGPNLSKWSKSAPILHSDAALAATGSKDGSGARTEISALKIAPSAREIAPSVPTARFL